MIVADTRFSNEEKSLLSSLIGSTFVKYRHDEKIMPDSSESAWGIIGIYTDEGIFALTDTREFFNVLGDEDDTPVVHFAKVAPDKIQSHLVGVKQRDWAVGKTIKDIKLYEDTQIMQENGVDIYEYNFTSSIIFQFENTQLVFEPEGWVMEIFLVHKGPKAEEKIQAAIDDIDEEDRDHIRVERIVTSLKDYREK